MARNLRRALADSRATATANYYGFTPAELKEYENIPRIQSKKQEIEVERKLLEKIGRSIERIEISLGRQYSIVTELNRESNDSNYKLSTIKNKTQKSKNLIIADNEKLKESIFIERSNMRELEHNLREFKKEKAKIERKITRLMEELETLQKGGKKRVVKRKARSVRPVIRRKPTVARRWM
jgi:DNA repair exonuclease SbcCD ATPase subunit